MKRTLFLFAYLPTHPRAVVPVTLHLLFVHALCSMPPTNRLHSEALPSGPGYSLRTLVNGAVIVNNPQMATPVQNSPGPPYHP